MIKRRILLADYVLAFDPSGAFYEGKGTTGWIIMDCRAVKVVDIGSIKATDYNTRHEYWDAHNQLIRRSGKQLGMRLAISIEDYLLYKQQALSQVNSTFETSQLLGIIKHFCWSYGFKYNMRNANAAKTRWNENILVRKGLIVERNGSYYLPDDPTRVLLSHELDAMKHAMHYIHFENDAEVEANEQLKP